MINILYFKAPDEGQKMLKLKQKLSILTNQIELSKGQNSTLPIQTIAIRDGLKQDIENILAAECTMCGSLMIQQLDENFDIKNDSW